MKNLSFCKPEVCESVQKSRRVGTTSGLINRIVEAIDEQYGVGEENYRRLTARRDARTRAVLDALDFVSAPDDEYSEQD